MSTRERALQNRASQELFEAFRDRLEHAGVSREVIESAVAGAVAGLEQAHFDVLVGMVALPVASVLRALRSRRRGGWS